MRWFQLSQRSSLLRMAGSLFGSCGHNVLMIGPPVAGKSMLAARLPGLLPPLDPSEALEVSMIHSLSGGVAEGGLVRRRPS